ncbi:two-component regulator propeller domain-containing protein [Mucilaginibacter sp. X5P1]|uniref:hybrid sensor histidine kinase/response regulator transcription factor n=1 Tax=Mucilaginibacter sp. X5P1 TaxID=2723088 RepID=UPI0016111397|nr:hybrid sensor histidine kinase/response regulator transcription factor [Mucilaginibacter sp. X5P1]MBB6136627.1 ligand-binding sensor domain-containing protein/signal transduction histidine kinase/DNA-binding response OmpR family regulator [Mucilaginibacter sp. X5P1]
MAPLPLMAQNLNLKFKHITTTDGLSGNTVESIFQDSRGYIWFGTRDGLNQYDGYSIKIFRNNRNNTKSISDNYIKCICEDAQHNIWIGTLNGLNKFDPYKNTFTTYKHDPSNKNSLSGSEINCLYCDKEGKLWVGTTSGRLNYYDAKNDVFKQLQYHKSYPSNLLNNEINDLYEDGNANLWIGTDKGICFYNQKTGAFVNTFKLAGNPDYHLNYSITKIQGDKQGNIWFGTLDDGIIVINLTRNTVKQFHHNDKEPFSLSTDQIRSLFIDKQDRIWTGGINGSLDLFNTTTSNFIHCKNVPGNPLSLSQKTISAIFEDDQNNLWIGTHRGGVNFYAPLADKFKLVQQQTDINSLSYNDVKSFCQDHLNNIWVGTDGGGLNLYNTTNNTFQHFKYNVYDTKSISSDAVLSINEDHYNNLWIGTWGGGLDLMNRTNNTFVHFVNNPADKNSISSNYVQATLNDSEGNFWVATYYGGLNLLDLKTHHFRRITSDLRQETSIFGNNIVALNEDKDKNVWIGTDDGGLNCYNLIKKKFKHYFISAEQTPDIRTIFTDSKGRVWVGQAGLYLFNKYANRFDLFTDKGGLSSEFIKGITEDKEDNLWISTSNGLTRLNPDNHSLKKYNIADGLQGLEFEAGSYMKTKDGEMYFGGINGFNKFYPQDIKINQFIAPVYITSFQIFNQNIQPNQKNSPLQKDISFTRHFVLNYQQSSISFEFALLNYTAPENNQYAYKLDGFDKAWHYNSTERNANYTNLDPGHYTFYVKAANNDGVWNNKFTSVAIDILPPFWGTWWFKLLMLVLFSTSAYFLLLFKKNLDLKKIDEKKREEMHNIQLQFFTNISHEFRTPLSLILGPVEKMMKEDDRLTFHQYYETIHRNANRLLLLINELMDFRKAETGAFRLKVMPGNLNIFIAEIAEDFKSLALQKQINLYLKIDKDLGETWFDRQIIEKIILNLMDNAFKYTKNGGSITIELYENEPGFTSVYEHQIAVNANFKGKKYAFIRVSDNGIGISNDSIQHLFERYYRITDAHMGSGVGLAFVKSLTLLHKGSIYVNSEKNVGSDFVVMFPVDKTDYSTNETWVSKSVNRAIQLESLSASVYQNENKELQELSKPAITKTNNQTYKILIVDDNDELRNFIRHSLAEFYQIIEAGDGIAALAIAKAELPDLIISDLMMPRMNGIDFCKELKKDKKTNQIPFIILSAKDVIESKIEGADSGADLYFPKPVSIHLLLLSIRNIFEQRSILKERYLKNYFLEAQEITDSENDKEFLDQLINLIELQLSNSDLDVDYICKEMGMSKTKLYNKIKGITGYSIGEFVRSFRLKKAANIITHEDVLLTDVMYRVGIQTQSYFTKAFKKEFGKTPSQFSQDIKNHKESY